MMRAEEFTERIAKSQKSMKKKKLDALVVSSTPDIRYVSNYNLLAGSALVMIPAEDNAVLLIDQEWDLLRAKDVSATPETKAAIDFTKALPRMLKNLGAIRRLGIVGWNAFPTPLYLSLKKTFPRAQFVSATELMATLRMIKSPAELECLRRAAKICDEGGRAAQENISPGKKEIEIAIEMEVAMKKSGASELSFPTILGSGDRTGLIVPLPTEKKLQAGDLVLMDFGGRSEGYCGDMSRTKQCGTVGQQQRDLFEVVTQMYTKAVEAVRPGVKAFEVHEVAKRVAREAGYEQYVMHMTGHGIGLEDHEIPILEKDRIPLVPGLVHSIEPGLYVPGVGGARLEDMVEVTDSGRKVLGTFSRAL